jgi:peptidoglycan hydrolase CwlO-like protein
METRLRAELLGWRSRRQGGLSQAWGRWLGLVCAIALVVWLGLAATTPAAPPILMAQSSQDLQDLQNKQKTLEQQRNQLQQQQDEIQNRQAEKESNLENLENNIVYTANQIAETQYRLDQAEKELTGV